MCPDIVISDRNCTRSVDVPQVGTSPLGAGAIFIACEADVGRLDRSASTSSPAVPAFRGLPGRTCVYADAGPSAGRPPPQSALVESRARNRLWGAPAATDPSVCHSPPETGGPRATPVRPGPHRVRRPHPLQLVDSARSSRDRHVNGASQLLLTRLLATTAPGTPLHRDRSVDPSACLPQQSSKSHCTPMQRERRRDTRPCMPLLRM